MHLSFCPQTPPCPVHAGIHTLLGRHRPPLGIHLPGHTPLPHGHCSGRYTSHWNAFLSMTYFYRAGGWPLAPPLDQLLKKVGHVIYPFLWTGGYLVGNYSEVQVRWVFWVSWGKDDTVYLSFSRYVFKTASPGKTRQNTVGFLWAVHTRSDLFITVSWSKFQLPSGELLQRRSIYYR